MPLAELKPLATGLLLPPAGPLLLALLGLGLAVRRRRAAGLAVAALGLLSLWFLACNAVAVALSDRLLPAVAPITAQRLAGVQAIVVLGGGVRPHAAEYGGTAQPSARTLARLRYAARLARQAGRPLAFAGGVGWSNAGTDTAAEAEVARRVLLEDHGLPLRWADDRSRDTAENARRMASILRPEGVQRIALVTDSWHMPRAEALFRRAGLDVVPAPTGFAGRYERPWLEWLPSAHGLTTSRQVVREWLALRLLPQDGRP